MTDRDSAPEVFRVLSWNLLDFTGLRSAGPGDRLDQVAVIRSRKPAVCAVQTILGSPTAAADHLTELADACGMCCQLDPHKRGTLVAGHAVGSAGPVALGVADSLCNTGLMWDPEQTEFQERSFDTIGRARGGFWHALVLAEFLTSSGTRLRIGSWQANPFDGRALPGDPPVGQRDGTRRGRRLRIGRRFQPDLGGP